MKVTRLALSLITCAILVGCSSSGSVNSNHLSADEISAELAEFRRLKPSLQRLAASETELKALIVTLDQLANADNPDYQPDAAPQQKNTEVEVLDKQVFNETVVTEPPVKAESIKAEPQVAEVSKGVEPAKTISKLIEKPVIAATKADSIALSVQPELAAVSVEKQSTVVQEPSETAVALPVNNSMESEVVETVKVQQRYALQLASVVNPNQLVSTWTQMQRRHSSILSGMEPLFEKYQKGKTTFYRLKAMGTLTVADARSACSSIVGQGGQCFIGSNAGVKSVTEL